MPKIACSIKVVYVSVFFVIIIIFIIYLFFNKVVYIYNIVVIHF